MSENKSEFEAVIHEINSKCSSLRSAAAMLKGARAPDADELLALMAQEARKLAQDLANFEAAQQARHRQFPRPEDR